MKWKQNTMYGLICEPYRIGKFLIGCEMTYLIWRDFELLGQSTDLLEIKRIADDDKRRMDATEL